MATTKGNQPPENTGPTIRGDNPTNEATALPVHSTTEPIPSPLASPVGPERNSRDHDALLGPIFGNDALLEAAEDVATDLDLSVGLSANAEVVERATEDATEVEFAPSDDPITWLSQARERRREVRSLVRTLVDAKVDQLRSMSALRDTTAAAQIAGPSRMDQAIRSARRLADKLEVIERDIADALCEIDINPR